MSAAAIVTDLRKRLVTRRTQYRRVFDTEPGHIVLRDLRKFCKIGQDIFTPGDPHKTAYLVGIQRVYLRIESILKMDEETIDALSRGNE